MVTGGEVLEMRRKVKYFSFLLHLGPTAEKKKNYIYLYAHIPIYLLCIVSQTDFHRILILQRGVNGRY